MLTLEFRFLAGRYHATPWGNHVNEGLVEWPPSPWRLCRALLATGFSKFGWREDDLPGDARALMTGLASALPSYRLPERVTVAHTRHYMPIRGKTARVLDTFVRLSRDEPLCVLWPVELPDGARTLLARLLGSMSCLGRAESWVSGRISDGPDVVVNCEPCDDGASARKDKELVPLLAALETTEYASWRQHELERILAASTAKKSRKLTEAFPEALLDCLLVSTGWMQKHGWSQPPGSRRVLYARPAEALAMKSVGRTPRRSRRASAQFGLLALRSNTVRSEVLPRLDDAVRVTEALHRRFARAADGQSIEVLTGKRGGRALQDNHQHVHYIPVDVRSDRRFGHVLLYAPKMLPHEVQAVVESTQWPIHVHPGRARDGFEEGGRDDTTALYVTAAGFGERPEIERVLAKLGDGAALLRRSRSWISWTPYIASRFVDARKHPVEDLVRKELLWRGIDVRVNVDVIHDGARQFLSFHRRRHPRRPQPPRTTPWCLRLQFDREVEGPIALGYGSHFGLGLFAPAQDDR